MINILQKPKSSSFVLLFLTLILMPMMTHISRAQNAENIKEPNVSGQFYDADPQELTRQVNSFINIRDAKIVPDFKNVQMMIAPHAGYQFSGRVAGYSFHAVKSRDIKTVIILAPSHYYGFDGASVWAKGGMKTPLGVAPVDEDFAKALLAADPKFIDDPKAYDKEHSLEVEIPFLQESYQDFKIVPVILGQMSFATCQKLAASLNVLIGARKDILIVVSSDMSHYHDGKTARTMDLATLEIITKLDAKDLYKQCLVRSKEMCGFIPVTTALLLAQLRGWDAEVLKYAHSGDVTGDNSKVVGYGSVVFYKKENAVDSLTKEHKRFLLDLAKTTIEQYVTSKKVVDLKITDSRLAAPEGAFVSIHRGGQLRGCIGNIVSSEPLQKTVRDMAIAAATEDPRFSPVTVEELGSLELEISVLSRPWRIRDIAEIEMGKHGVIVAKGKSSRGIFLPQVAKETGWSKEKFLSELCSQKAGLPADCWKDPQVEIDIFTADVFK